MSEAKETLDLESVAALFQAEPDTVAQYARTGELPGTRIGKGWIFLREDALAFLRERIARDTAARKAAHAQANGEMPESKKQSTPGLAAVLHERRPRRRRTELPALPPLVSSTRPSP